MAKQCPLCGATMGLFNSSLVKLEGKRLCSKCATDLAKVYPGRFSYKDVTLQQASDRIARIDKCERHIVPSSIEPEVPKRAQCPHCHSTNIVPMGQKQKNYSLGKAAAGAVLFTPAVGALVGFTGSSSRKHEFYCQDCGEIFKR